MSDSFGATAAKTGSAAELLELEHTAGKAERFATLDRLTGDVICRLMTGKRVVKTKRDHNYGDTATLQGLDQESRAFLVERFAASAQQERGGWFIPETVSVRAGRINLPYYYAQSPRFGGAMIDVDHSKPAVDEAGDSLFIWSILEPLGELLYAPIDLRSRLAGDKTVEDRQKKWDAAEALYHGLGLDLADALDPLRLGNGWSRLDAAAQTAHRTRLLERLAEVASQELGAQYRASRLRLLIDRYYKRAKAGRALRKQVLTKAEERTLVGFFGGDWLAFLDYLGEQPAEGEEIVTALPETRLFTGRAEKVADIAAAEHVPVEEVERVLAAVWNQQDSTSPIEARVSALRTFWQRFDELHSRQAPGMPSLWGLTEEGHLFDIGVQDETSAFSRGLYKEMLPEPLLADIREHWDGALLPRWPEAIVTCLSPIEEMAAAFGPALAFWNGVGLTAWFLCEGPYSRTNMAGLATYHARDLAELAKLGCGVDPSVFEELSRIEKTLPEAEPDYKTIGGPKAAALGIELRVSISVGGPRLKGFEKLRDAITRHRRAWAEANLESYLAARWRSEVEVASQEHSRFLAAKGKPPTAKQFAKIGAPAVNHWFGGDLTALYAVIGERSPVKQERRRLVPANKVAFAHAVFQELGGKPYSRQLFAANHEVAQEEAGQQQRYYRIRDLASDSLRFLQLEEAIGARPDLTVFGKSKFSYVANELWGGVDRGWSIYTQAIEKTLAKPLPHVEEAHRPAVTTQPVASQGRSEGKRSFVHKLLGR